MKKTIAFGLFLAAVSGAVASTDSVKWSDQVRTVVQSGYQERNVAQAMERLNACISGQTQGNAQTFALARGNNEEDQLNLITTAKNLSKEFLPKLMQDLASISCNAQKAAGGAGHQGFRDWNRNCAPFFSRISKLESEIRTIWESVYISEEEAGGDMNSPEASRKRHDLIFQLLRQPDATPKRELTEEEVNTLNQKITEARTLVTDLQAFLQSVAK